MEAKIKEIFESIQGEGPLVGYNQIFIRFCGCNLCCSYCDTDFALNNAVTYSPDDLAKKIRNEYDLNNIHSISLTGGEPLLHDDFINDFLSLIPEVKIYLETNATLPKQLLKVKNKIDIISADIKLPSSTGKDTFKEHEEFLSNCAGIYTFAKVVFDNNVTEDEIKKCADICNNYEIELILQPKMLGNQMAVSGEYCQKILHKFLKLHQKTRLIPQVHKFINLR